MNTKRKTRYHKSTRGCKTCKIRRVKCDETLPWCLRCTSTGRQCEGPQSHSVEFIHVNDNDNDNDNHNKEEISRPSSSSSTSHSKNDTELVRASSYAPCNLQYLSYSPWSHKPYNEQQIFHIFLARTAPIISGDVDDQFWAKLIPYMASHNDVVWNSTLAIGALWGYPVHSHHGSVIPGLPMTTQQLQAFEWYDRAITNQQRIWTKSKKPTDLMLTTTMFATFELQKGGFQNGLRLLRTGFLVLSPLLTWRPDEYEWTDAVIVRMYMRSACLYATSELDTSFDTSDFHNYSGARETLFRIMFAVMGLIKEVYFALTENTPTIPDIHASQVHLDSRARQWHARFQSIPEQPNHSISSGFDSNHDKAYLHLYHETVALWLTVPAALHPGCPIQIHNTTALFTMILHIAKTITLVNRHPNKPVYFNDMIILPPLYMVSILCTDQDIRNAALTMMRENTSQHDHEQGHGLVITPQGQPLDQQSMLEVTDAMNDEPSLHRNQGQIQAGTLLRARRFQIEWPTSTCKKLMFDRYADILL